MRLGSRSAVISALASMVAGGVGCGEALSVPSLVEDLRVLAIRAEPPELLIDRDATVAQAVTFDALVVDPRGTPMNVAWRFCPVASDQTCADFDRRKSQAPAAFRPLLDATFAQTKQEPVMAGKDAGGVAALGAFAVEVPAALFAYHFDDSWFGLGNGGWTSAVLEVKSGSETLVGQKRLVLNARDLAQWNPELAAVGVTICAEPAAPGCVPLRPRTPNRNPAITSVEVAMGEKASSPFAPVVGPILVAPGAKMRLRPVLSTDAAEAFQTLEPALDGNRLNVIDHTEEITISWFATDGSFDAELTAAQVSRTLDTVFEAPAEGAARRGHEIAVFMVARDQRGGTGWSRVDVRMAR